MTNDKFSELVNLYLDKEISEADLLELKGELAANDALAQSFHERVRLHQATLMAMHSRQNRSSRSGSRQRSIRSERSGRRRRTSASPLVNFPRPPRWVVAGGLAACLCVGAILLTNVARDPGYLNSQARFVSNADASDEGDLLDSIGRLEWRRFAAAQASTATVERASLASQLRLMGLRPELTPEQKRLRSVDLAALEAARFSRSGAELLAEVQKISPMPEASIFRAGSLMSPPEASQWPVGFQSFLASFR